MSAAGALNIVFQGKRFIDYNNTTTNLLTSELLSQNGYIEGSN